MAYLSGWYGERGQPSRDIWARMCGDHHKRKKSIPINIPMCSDTSYPVHSVRFRVPKKTDLLGASISPSHVVDLWAKFSQKGPGTPSDGYKQGQRVCFAQAISGAKTPLYVLQTKGGTKSQKGRRAASKVGAKFWLTGGDKQLKRDGGRR